MSMNWTKEQQQVIKLDNRNILVSAAAGSGKTAVLVERIIQKITDPKHPVDIDRLLVVTFTKAVAAEMRERIGAAIDKLRETQSEDVNLERQLTLIHNAQITTIDSFCLYVVRNHFQEINLDPNFRIADPGEIQLLEKDVLGEVFESNYASEDNDRFLYLIDAYSGKRNDHAVRDMVLKIYHLSQSNPWPKSWMEDLCSLYRVDSAEALLQTELIKEITAYAKTMLIDARECFQALFPLALAEDGPLKYYETLENDVKLLSNVEELEEYGQIAAFLENLSFGNLSAIRNFTGDEAKKERIQKERKAIKASIDEIKKKYFTIPLEGMVDQLNRMQPVVEELIRVAVQYMDTLAKTKREKRIADFNDIEHFALNILVDETTREQRPTAQEFQELFEEIMIDEYQDSNQVQEEIMCAISRMSKQQYNMLMVGDVKQSIYRFRLARPELFMEKYASYDTDESETQRIDLHQNFRSRKEVVEAVNDVFYKIMGSDLGNVEYDEDAALYYGADYPEAGNMDTEVLLFDTNAELLENIRNLSARQLEARMVAERIKKLMKSGQVTDKKTGGLRPVHYSDIVILFRSIKDWGSEFAQTLEACGIPAHVEASTGYFASSEVQTVLNMLKILDNPYQDIPMAAVLKSAIAGLTDEELAEIRILHPDLSFAEAAVISCEEAEEGKLLEFWNMYTKLRAQVSDTPIHELIQKILDVTGYGNYAASLPAGIKREANLHMLLEKAVTYEATSYKGLFHFVRYIDQLQKYDVDFGEAEVIGEQEDVVHIMTIHKSKGLEFPIVFVSGINKQFNQMDTRDAMVLHPDLGIGLYEQTCAPRMKRPSFVRNEIANRILSENLGEELRVLYVALTRAKEKLILTGTVKDAGQTLQKYTGASLPEQKLGYGQRIGAKSYMDWIIPALLSYPGKYNITIADPTEIVMEQALKMAEGTIGYQELMENVQNADEHLMEELTADFDYAYPYQSEAGKKSKYSVSELKHDSMVLTYDAQEAETPDFLKEDKESYIPAFMQQENSGNEDGGVQGALRGTAVHRVMECLDFASICEIDRTDIQAVGTFVSKELDRMECEEKITNEMRMLVIPDLIIHFVQSDLALRMAVADQGGLLFREKPFVMDYDGALLQGIIDVFWLEDGHIVLMDYKTDRVKKAEELVERYETQLCLYADALKRIFSTEEQEKAVKECLIYSFRLQEVIKI